MGVVIESSVWRPDPSFYAFIFFSCFVSIFLPPYFSKNSSNKSPPPIDHGLTSSLIRAQRSFLLLYSLASVTEGLWSVLGEFELAYYGVGREKMVVYLCVGYLAAVVFGTFFGMLGDLVGQKNLCLIFWVLHLFVAIWKRFTMHSSIWVGSISLSLAASIFSVNFETWMVVEHEKLGYRQDALSDVFWLMTFSESASFIGSQILANWLVDNDEKENIVFPPIVVVFLAIVGIICTTRGWAETETSQRVPLKDYKTSFFVYIFGDKRIWLLVCAQAWLHFSIAFFWILWAPTLVADGREVHLGLVYPCILGARMLGSTAFPWLISRPSPIRTEDYLVYAFGLMGLVLSITAYDYQEIGYLLMLFCIFHACVGLILPSLARLRSIYVPNELRGGMISLSLAPANAATLFFPTAGPFSLLIRCLSFMSQRGYYGNLGNAAVMAFAAVGLFIAAGCMHALKRCGKQPYQDSHKL